MSRPFTERFGVVRMWILLEFLAIYNFIGRNYSLFSFFKLDLDGTFKPRVNTLYYSGIIPASG